MYVSDIPEILKCNNFEFADDLVILSIVKNTKDSDLLNLENYCNEKELKLNAQKTKHLRIGLKNCNLSGYVLQNEIIETVNSHKHLGVTYDNKMSFNFHCNDIINKAYSKYNVMKHICNQVDGQTFLRIYKTYILPIIEYSNLCWTPTQTQSDNIEKIKKRITKYICYKLSKSGLHYEQRLNLLNLKTLKSRRDMKILKIVHKIRSHSFEIPINWFSYLNFYTTNRNAIFY